ncbi:MAG: acyl-ACP thioesterase [Acidobacteria bacterium]|nr:acyl-ACP thioesterase [Acidobacteriota bacterium]
MANTWTDRRFVRSGEIDPHGRLTIPTLCGYLQEAAGSHAHALGFSIEQIAGRGYTWVLSRLHLRMDRFPHWREEVFVDTWPSNLEGVMATREYRLRDGVGLTIGIATSGWLVIDLERRRPVRIPDFMREPGIDVGERVLRDDFDRLPVPQPVEAELRWAVRWHDLDLNQHVNNVRYAEWVLESAPPEMLQSCTLRSLELDFRGECRFGAEVAIRRGPVPEGSAPAIAHVIVDASDGRELCVARTSWQVG